MTAPCTYRQTLDDGHGRIRQSASHASHRMGKSLLHRGLSYFPLCLSYLSSSLTPLARPLTPFMRALQYTPTDSRIWNASTFACEEVLDEGSWINAIVCIDDRIFVGTHNNYIGVWSDAASEGHPVKVGSLEGHHDWVSALTAIPPTVAVISPPAPPSEFLCSGSWDHTVRVFDIRNTASGAATECTHVLRGHVGAVFALASNAAHVFSGSFDRTIVRCVRGKSVLPGLIRRSFGRACRMCVRASVSYLLEYWDSHCCLALIITIHIYISLSPRFLFLILINAVT